MSWFVYESAVQKTKYYLTCSLLHPLFMLQTVKEGKGTSEMEMGSALMVIMRGLEYHHWTVKPMRAIPVIQEPMTKTAQ